MKSINEEIRKVEKEFEDAEVHANLCEFESCPMCVRFFGKKYEMKILKEVKEWIEEFLKEHYFENSKTKLGIYRFMDFEVNEILGEE